MSACFSPEWPLACVEGRGPISQANRITQHAYFPFLRIPVCASDENQCSASLNEHLFCKQSWEDFLKKVNGSYVLELDYSVVPDGDGVQTVHVVRVRRVGIERALDDPGGEVEHTTTGCNRRRGTGREWLWLMAEENHFQTFFTMVTFSPREMIILCLKAM